MNIATFSKAHARFCCIAFDTFTGMRLFVLLLLFVSCTNSDAPERIGKVVSVADGDTFTLLTTSNEQFRIRLYGIDAPEKAQPFGTVARQGLSDLLFGKMARVVRKSTDQYGRTVAMVYNSQGLNVNEEMLRRGLAWHYKVYDQNPQWDEIVTFADRRKLGLWADANPTPPWLWRKLKRQSAD